MLSGISAMLAAVALGNSAMSQSCPNSKGDSTALLNSLNPGSRFFSKLQARIDAAMANDLEFVIALYDVQGLNQINEKYGASIGNRIIGATAGILKQAFESDALISRIESDKFAVAVSSHDYADIRDTFAIVRRLKSRTIDRDWELPWFEFVMVHCTIEKGFEAKQIMANLRERLEEEKAARKSRESSRHQARVAKIVNQIEQA
jgi:GGDEF domain-containing protein